MAVTAYGQVFHGVVAPEESPVKIGSLWVDLSGTATLKIATAIAPYTFAEISGSGVLADGDYGDVTVSGTGTVITIDDGVVTPAKMNDGTAVSVLGRSANSSGVRADIAAANDNEFLRRRSSVVGFGSIVAGDIVGKSRRTVQTTTSTGSQNNFSITDGYTVLICSNASALILTGASIGGSAPSAGDVLIIHNEGTSTVKVTKEDTNSTAANRFDTPSAGGQIIGTDGTMVFVYEAGSMNRWHLVSVESGAPLSVAYAAGNFTASGSMTWTVESGDQYQFQYQQQGKLVKIWLSINTSSVGGTPSTTLVVAIPGGFTTVLGGAIVCRISDNGTGAASICSINGSATTMNFYKDFTAAANWTASTNNTAVQGFFEFEIA